MHSILFVLSLGFLALCSVQVQHVASQPGRGGGGGEGGGNGHGSAIGSQSGHGGEGPIIAPTNPRVPWIPVPRPTRPPPPPPFLGVFQSAPATANQVNMYQIYSDAYSQPVLTNELIVLTITRNGSTFELLEQAEAGGVNTTVQSMTFQLPNGNSTEATLLGGIVSNVRVRQLGFNQLLFSYNSTAAGGGLTTMLLTAGFGLTAEYRAGNDTGSRDFRQPRTFSGHGAW